MKKLLSLIALGLVGTGIYLAQPKLKEFAGIHEKPEEKPFVPPSSRILKSQRRPVKELPADESPQCTSLRSQLDLMDFNDDPEDWLALTSLESFEACQDSFYQERIKTVLKACASEEINVQECQVSVLSLRAQIRMREIKEPGNREEMMDFIFDEFSKKDPNFKRMKNISRRFLDESPDDLSMQKVWATSAVVAEGDPRKLSEESKQEIYDVIGEEQMSSNPELRPIDVLIKSGLEPNALESMARDLQKRYPKDPKNTEMLAWSLWQQGRREESLNYLNSLSSDDPWIRDLKEKLSNKNARKEDFPGRINIGLSFNDLTN